MRRLLACLREREILQAEWQRAAALRRQTASRRVGRSLAALAADDPELAAALRDAAREAGGRAPRPARERRRGARRARAGDGPPRGHAPRAHRQPLRRPRGPHRCRALVGRRALERLRWRSSRRSRSARQALLANERAIGVTGHNIANVNTPGYSRQMPLLHASRPDDRGFGTGVEVAAVVRSVDGFLEARQLASASSLGGATTGRQLLDRLQALFPVGDEGVGNALAEFFAAAQRVADSPQDLAYPQPAARGRRRRSPASSATPRAASRRLQREADQRLGQAAFDANATSAEPGAAEPRDHRRRARRPRDQRPARSAPAGARRARQAPLDPSRRARGRRRERLRVVRPGAC